MMSHSPQATTAYDEEEDSDPTVSPSTVSEWVSTSSTSRHTPKVRLGSDRSKRARPVQLSDVRSNFAAPSRPIKWSAYDECDVLLPDGSCAKAVVKEVLQTIKNTYAFVQLEAVGNADPPPPKRVPITLLRKRQWQGRIRPSGQHLVSNTDSPSLLTTSNRNSPPKSSSPPKQRLDKHPLHPLKYTDRHSHPNTTHESKPQRKHEKHTARVFEHLSSDMDSDDDAGPAEANIVSARFSSHLSRQWRPLRRTHKQRVPSDFPSLYSSSDEEDGSDNNEITQVKSIRISKSLHKKRKAPERTYDDQLERSSVKKRAVTRLPKAPLLSSRDNQSDDSDFDVDGGYPLDQQHRANTCRPALPSDVPKSTVEKPFVLGSIDGVTYEVPAKINQYLREYQREGVRFIFNRFASQKGALLGDDMGLGKTVQVISLLAALFHVSGNPTDISMLQRMQPHRPVLILCPKSLVENWKDEIEAWTYLRVSTISGAQNRNQVLQAASRNRLDVVICTYQACQKYIKQFVEYTEKEGEVYQSHKFDWLMIVFDEAHRIKNHNGALIKSLREFHEIQIRQLLGLSGTPLQNKWQELHTLLDFLNPGCLGSWTEFNRCTVKDMVKGMAPNATGSEIASSRKLQKEFSRRIEPFFLQRLKSDVVARQLPKKTDEVILCSLTDMQKACYENLVKSQDFQTILNSFEICDCNAPWSNGQSFGLQSPLEKSRCCYFYSNQHFAKRCTDGCDIDLRRDRETMWWHKCAKCHCQDPNNARTHGCMPIHFVRMQVMSQLLHISNHLGLFLVDDVDQMTQREMERRNRRNRIIFEGYEHWLSSSMNDATMRKLSDPNLCGKMRVLKSLLTAWWRENKGHKILLFSGSTRILDMIQRHQESEGINFVRIDGSISSTERAKRVRKFQKDKDVFIFLISTAAGGEGLTLTAANKVIIFDPNWNPAQDLQAQDRAYRMGQRREVNVYRFISVGTIEERLYARQMYKQQLSNLALTTDAQRRVFNEEEDLRGIKNLFKFSPEFKSFTLKFFNAEVDVADNLTRNGYAITENQARISAEQVDNQNSQTNTADSQDYGIEAVFNDSIDDVLKGTSRINHNQAFIASEHEKAMTAKAEKKATAASFQFTPGASSFIDDGPTRMRQRSNHQAPESIASEADIRRVFIELAKKSCPGITSLDYFAATLMSKTTTDIENMLSEYYK